MSTAQLTAGAPRHHRIRSITTWVLIVATGLIVPLVATGTWALRTVTNTDHYVATLAPLVENPAIQDAMTTTVVNSLFTAVNVEEKVASHLPGPSKALAGAITSSIRREAEKVVHTVIASPAFVKIWNVENRLTHHLAVSILTGDSSTSANKLTVSVQALALKVIAELDKRGITLFDPLVITINKLGENGIVLSTTEQLHTAQTVFHYGITLRGILPLALLAVVALALVVGVNKRRTGLRLGAAALIGVVTLSVVLSFGRSTFVGAVPENSRGVADAVWTTLLRGLKTEIRLLSVLFALIVLVAWLFGTSPTAQKLRGQLRRGLAWGRTHAIEASHSDLVVQARKEVADRRGLVAGIIGGIAGCILVFSSSTTVAWWTIGLAAIAIVALCAPLLKKAA